MFESKSDQEWVAFTLSATQEMFDKAVVSCASFVKQRCAGLTGPVPAVLRELLASVIETETDSETEVRCRIELLAPCRFKVTVEMDGGAAAFSALNPNSASGSPPSVGTSLGQIDALADQVLFDQNNGSVTAYITVPERTDYEVRADGDERTILATGDLTAASADALRSLLAGMMDEGCRRYRLDLSRVTEIAPMSLAVLHGFQRALESRDPDATVIIEKPNRDVDELFRLTGLSRRFRVAQ